MMNILCIGNSFSEDATAYLVPMAANSGHELYCANLYIGGCPLERHHSNLLSGEAAYDYQLDGRAVKKTSLAAALTERAWDAVTVQQCSGLSGVYESYEPHLTALLGFIAAYQPQAKVYFHNTWAYETGSDHRDFPRYGCDQRRMYDAVCAASARACAVHRLGLIPSGELIQALRETSSLDLVFTRDGYHMNIPYGRYALAALWCAMFAGEVSADYSPDPSADPSVLAVIRKYAAFFAAEAKRHNETDCRFAQI